MKIALLSPGSWWTHPKYYEPWETVVSLLYEGLIKRGVDVTLFTKTRGSWLIFIGKSKLGTKRRGNPMASAACLKRPGI